MSLNIFGVDIDTQTLGIWGMVFQIMSGKEQNLNVEFHPQNFHNHSLNLLPHGTLPCPKCPRHEIRDTTQKIVVWSLFIYTLPVPKKSAHKHRSTCRQMKGAPKLHISYVWIANNDDQPFYDSATCIVWQVNQPSLQFRRQAHDVLKATSSDTPWLGKLQHGPLHILRTIAEVDDLQNDAKGGTYT